MARQHRIEVGMAIRVEGEDWAGKEPPDSGAVIVALEQALAGLDIYVGPRRVRYDVTGVQHDGSLFTIRTGEQPPKPTGVGPFAR